MSNFTRITRHPITRHWEAASWIDGYYGDAYAIKFPNDPTYYYDKWFNFDDVSVLFATDQGRDTLVGGELPTQVKATQAQVGGDHYKNMKIQPVEFIHANGLDFLQGNIVKYISRHKSKGGRKDIEKVIHYAQLILELDYPEEKSTQMEFDFSFGTETT